MYDSKWVSIWRTSISNSTYALLGFLYVDNIDIVALNQGRELEEEVVARAQLLLDHWQFALQLTGGELKFSKCFWTLQSYTWKNGQCEISKNTSFQLTIKDGDRRVPIKYLP